MKPTFAKSPWLALLITACGGGTTGGTGLPPDGGTLADAGAQADIGVLADVTTLRETSSTIDAQMCPCVQADITWGFNGGLVAYDDQSAVIACSTFTHRRTPHTDPAISCTHPLDDTACVTSQIASVLAHPDMVAALAASPALYGVDSRPVDGAVYRISVGGKIVEVGYPCGVGATGCRAIPAGVQAAVDFFKALEFSEMARGSCKTAFPDFCKTYCPDVSMPAAAVCGADGFTYDSSQLAACCGIAVAHEGGCGDYKIVDLATDALRKTINKVDARRSLCFRVVLTYATGLPMGRISTPPHWIEENAWYSTNITDCDSVGPETPGVSKPVVSAVGSITMMGGGGGGSMCSFSIHAGLVFADLPSEAMDADNLAAGSCP